jgi:hypothetical protein
VLQLDCRLVQWSMNCLRCAHVKRNAGRAGYTGV